MINVTKTWLPSKSKYNLYLDRIFKSGWVTNNGFILRELEERLAEYLGVRNLVLTANGSQALELAYRLLKLEGELITSPFSFVATTSTICSVGIKPVFCDIDPATFNLDPAGIELKISENTTGIVPVHIYGNACDISSINKIAVKHNLKTVYDAAHAFAVNYKDKSILSYGDISILSFHATKIFHTIEGGALIINDQDLLEEARLMINFGIDNIDSVKSWGINSKMNEFEAAMGLCLLDDMEEILTERERVYNRYKDVFAEYSQQLNPDANYNYSYFPLLCKDEQTALNIKSLLKHNGINVRRYFYPSLDRLDYLQPQEKCENSVNISSRILSLPIYPYLEIDDQNRIIDIVKKNL